MIRHAARRLLLTAVLAALVAPALGASVRATTWTELTIDEMVARTDLGFAGEVEAVRVEMREGDPWTVVSFRIDTPLVGLDAEPDRIDLPFWGGTAADGSTLSVAGMPSFDVGERVLLLAYDDAGLASPVVGFAQGVWRLEGATWTDLRGRRLTLDPEGGLIADGEGSLADEATEALRTALEARP